jgi:hypothetical protein
LLCFLDRHVQLFELASPAQMLDQHDPAFRRVFVHRDRLPQAVFSLIEPPQKAESLAGPDKLLRILGGQSGLCQHLQGPLIVVHLQKDIGGQPRHFCRERTLLLLQLADDPVGFAKTLSLR